MRIDVEDLRFAYAPSSDGSAAVDGMTLTIPRGELLALLGPSGSGKTTLLLLIAGLLRPDRGAIRFDGRIASDPGRIVPPRRRRVGIVFQDLALWPHMTVEEHIEFALGEEHLARDERRRRRDEILAMAEISDLARKLPAELSGGEAQRLALARALAGRPGILLLDEPLGSLDRRLREALLPRIAEMHRHLGPTTIYVTHDHEEALSIAARAAIVDAGRLVQTATPEQIYRFPATPTAARLSGPATILEGRSVAGGAVELALGTFRAAFHAEIGTRILAVLRPEDVRVRPDPDGPAIVEDVRFRAGRWDIDLRRGDVSIRGESAVPLVRGRRVAIEIREPVWGFGDSNGTDHG
ncbi:MAG: ABC transporter ATP-binding protein [Planctomycetes bacterium]|nr:ABC transporter ATP-binding protein [Planctomycetota bacterium]